MTIPSTSSPARRFAAGAAALVLATLATAACAVEPEGPLAPLDTSSPRATLQGFMQTVDRIAANFLPNQRQRVREENARLCRRALGCLDLSAIPPSLIESKGREAAVHLKEVLDRIPLPPADAIPDATMAKAGGIDRWRLPGTEIVLVRLATGSRAGEFVFSTETVSRAEEFFERVRGLPYRADAGSPGLFDAYVQLGGWMIPESVIRRLPAWTHTRLAGETVWQWIATTIVALAAAAAAALAWRLRERVPTGVARAAEKLIFPAVLVTAGTVIDSLCSTQIRLTGDNLVAAKIVTRAVTLVGVITGVLDAVAWATERLLAWRRLGGDSIEGQLVRLASNVGRFLLVAWIVISAADSFGVPVTPLVAGLGAGGLAIALASQYTVENLIAGLVIFADKPVRIGDECQYGSVRGRVERIGLRSTRIRGTDRTVITIPNAEFAKSQLVNYSNRDRIPFAFTLTVPAGGGPDGLRRRLVRLRDLVGSQPGIDRAASDVRLGDPAADGVTVAVTAVFVGGDETAAAACRESLLLATLEIVAGPEAAATESRPRIAA